MQDQNDQNVAQGGTAGVASGAGGAGAPETLGAMAGAAEAAGAAGNAGAGNGARANAAGNDGSTPDPVKALENATAKAAQGDFVQKVVTKLKSSENILIALAQNPSVDEIAAAIGLALYLDGIQKHTTAVYSGSVPESLAFLRPEAVFETNTASLQDFIISLNKDKADHLRYKLEGDDVKVFITPYKTVITEEDLSFSHGDYNVDFVIAINVPAAGNLDPALKDHSRIMRDAAIVDITTNAPGRFGEIEWSDPAASSVSEMVTRLIFAAQGDDATLDQDVATALLTGIVAATARFSNERTNSDTLGLASKLMSMGADQQLISSNVGGNEIIQNDNVNTMPVISAENMVDQTQLEVAHEDPAEMNMMQMPEVVMPGMGLPGVGGGNVAGGVNPVVPSADVTNGANPVVQPTMNLAAQAAPEMANAAEAVAPVDGTNNVAPENIVVQPVIPGANGGVMATEGAGTSSDVVSDGGVMQNPGEMQLPVTPATPTEDATRRLPENPDMMQLPNIPQVGVTIQPPEKTAQTTKNYAEMMEQALAEGTGGADMGAAEGEQSATEGVAPVNGAEMTPVSGPEMMLPGTNTGEVLTGDTMATGGVGNVLTAPPVGETGTSVATESTGEVETPVAEPVVKPTEAILPPPPAPNTDGMMPPVLPTVQ